MPRGGDLRGPSGRARDALRANLTLVDLVLEIADARAPRTTRFAGLPRLVRGKPLLLVLTHEDLADGPTTRRWLTAMPQAVAVNAGDEAGIRPLVKRLAQWPRHKTGRALRFMVVGLPNVGKSSVLNRLAAGRKAPVGNRPGITRGPQWIDARGLMALDLPGILPWSSNRPWMVCALGLVPQSEYEAEDVARSLYQHLVRVGLPNPYGWDAAPSDDTSFFETLAEARGFVLSAGRLDLRRAFETMLRDFQSGRLGRLSLERPDD